MLLRKAFCFWICSIGMALPLAAQSAKAAAPAAITGVEGARLAETIPLDGTLYHVQGVDLDRDHIWVTSVDQKDRKAYLHQFSRRTHKLERRVDLTPANRCAK